MTASAIRTGLLLTLAFAPALQAPGQDRVVLKRGRFAGRIVVSGEIEELTGEAIRLRTAQGENVHSYPAGEVVSIETSRTEPHDRGLKFLAENRVDEAIAEFETAVRAESRTWVRREILARIVHCCLRKGDYSRAAARFLALYRSDPTTQHFRVIPLAWAPEPLTPVLRDEARSWMQGNTDVARLIGSSLLVEDAEYRPLARTVLRELATNPDRRIQVFAQMQGWRLELAAGPVSELQVLHWQERLDELPQDLRAGPAYVLGRAYLALNDYELAAATFLWLPVVDDHDYRLAARACLEAGVALDKIGQRAEAQGLFHEVSRRFADAPSAEEAGRRLREAAGSSDAAEKGPSN